MSYIQCPMSLLEKYWCCRLGLPIVGFLMMSTKMKSVQLRFNFGLTTLANPKYQLSQDLWILRAPSFNITKEIFTVTDDTVDRVVKPKLNLNPIDFILVPIEITHHEKSNDGSTKSTAPIFLKLWHFEGRDYEDILEMSPYKISVK